MKYRICPGAYLAVLAIPAIGLAAEITFADAPNLVPPPRADTANYWCT